MTLPRRAPKQVAIVDRRQHLERHFLGVSASSALVLTATTQLRFLPAANFNGTVPNLTAHLIDSSAAITNNSTVNMSVAAPPAARPNTAPAR